MNYKIYQGNNQDDCGEEEAKAAMVLIYQRKERRAQRWQEDTL